MTSAETLQFGMCLAEIINISRIVYLPKQFECPRRTPTTTLTDQFKPRTTLHENATITLNLYSPIICPFAFFVSGSSFPPPKSSQTQSSSEPVAQFCTNSRSSPRMSVKSLLFPPTRAQKGLVASFRRRSNGTGTKTTSPLIWGSFRLPLLGSCGDLL